ncbi:uncharacterized protein LOC5579351 [Aedes aegypti]|uniref:C2H2-type domain-containing protein n=2 Tax=Aedes aegypti TaxID=7159 RepID=A0A903V104_AEDAE|nr:uncharacterized protein LOC5579351 [Aedes aegypti]
MSIMATTTKTKMKPTTNEFLSGDGVDMVGNQKPVAGAEDPDDLDLFLSEITVQFDDGVQTLYVGPVEIVDDDDEDVGTDGKFPVDIVAQTKEEMVDDLEPSMAIGSPLEAPESEDTVKRDDVTVDVPPEEVEAEAATFPSPAVTVDAASDNNRLAEEDSNTQQEELPVPADAVDLPEPEAGGGEPPRGIEEEEDGDVDSNSANDDRLHRLTAAGVVIDPKNGAAEQPVPIGELISEPDPGAHTPPLELANPDKELPPLESSTLEEEPVREVQPQPIPPEEIVSPQPEVDIAPISKCTETKEPESEQSELDEEQLPTTQPSTSPCPSPRKSPRKAAIDISRSSSSLETEERQLEPVQEAVQLPEAETQQTPPRSSPIKTAEPTIPETEQSQSALDQEQEELPLTETQTTPRKRPRKGATDISRSTTSPEKEGLQTLPRSSPKKSPCKAITEQQAQPTIPETEESQSAPEPEEDELPVAETQTTAIENLQPIESEDTLPGQAQEEELRPTTETQPTTPQRSSPKRSLRRAATERLQSVQLETEQPQKTPPRPSPKKTRLRATSERLKPTIKEEIKQLTPVLPAPIDEVSPVVKKLEQEQQNQLAEEEQEEESPEGELIVPDVLVPQQPYDKDSSPAGSDSGIENEGTDLGKVTSPEEGDESGLTGVTDETAENIPEEIGVGEIDQGQGGSEENVNTQVVVLEEIVIQGAKGTLIQCAQCAMLFRKELWYKKHLMNYHGIDLSNIAHFLSNLQTLDEGIQDGDGTTEQEFEEFQLEEGSAEDGGNNEATDKTEDEEGESSKRKSEDYAVQVVKRVREEKEAASTPSPATMQMYPEVKMSTGKQKAGRRRKEKLVLINSDADMRIKHEYAPAAVHSEESTSTSSQSSQPLMNNMFVVRYLEQAALMVGTSGTSEGSSLNKENSKFGSSDPLSFEELDDGMTPFERSKIVETNEEGKIIFTCSICESEFEVRQAVQDHVNIVHKDVKRRSCPHCGRTFNQTGDLTRHVRIHTGIRPFKCPFDGCEYAFISSGDLHKHVRRHNQMLNPVPKPHVCNVCGKDFERGYDLKRHSSMHAKDDPNFQGFNCELCGKMFARKDQYRAHTYRHIGYKPHKCSQCDKTFSDASNYAKHVKVHAMDGIELFCHHCEKAFKNKMAISKHVLRCKYKTAARKTSSKKKASVVKKEIPESAPSSESPSQSTA